MIIFKPNGSLDIDTDPSDLPEEVSGLNIISGAFKRCKNLRMDEMGVLRVRDGSYKLNATALVGTMNFIIEQGGVRYVFGEAHIYRNESLISGSIQCEAPEFSPGAGLYASAQSVTITTGTIGATIYYTLDGSTPSNSSTEYSSAITVPLFSTLKAIAIRSSFLDSNVTTAYYSASQADFVSETNSDNMVTETNSNDLIGEGTS